MSNYLICGYLIII